MTTQVLHLYSCRVQEGSTLHPLHRLHHPPFSPAFPEFPRPPGFGNECKRPLRRPAEQFLRRPEKQRFLQCSAPGGRFWALGP